MHMHSHRSFDCSNRPQAMLRAARERGLDRIVVTDHNEIRGALELQQLDPDRVIVGEEVKSREGFDIIGIFIRELIPKGTPAVETCERIREQGGVVYLPHPFDSSRSGGPALLSALAEHVDVVEVHNARCFPRTLNEKARVWAGEIGKLRGAGSDAHTISEIGRGFVSMPRFDHERDSFLAALAKGEIGGVSTSPIYRLASSYAKVKKMLFGEDKPSS